MLAYVGVPKKFGGAGAILKVLACVGSLKTCWAFAMAGLTVWNCLLENLPDPDFAIVDFKRLLCPRP